MTLYKKIATAILDDYSNYKQMTYKEIAEGMRKQFNCKVNGATIHTLMQGIEATKNYTKNDKEPISEWENIEARR